MTTIIDKPHPPFKGHLFDWDGELESYQSVVEQAIADAKTILMAGERFEIQAVDWNRDTHFGQPLKPKPKSESWSIGWYSCSEEMNVKKPWNPSLNLALPNDPSYRVKGHHLCGRQIA